MHRQRQGSTALELRGVCRKYRQGGQWLEVLRGIDLEIGHGETVALTGPSGSGKSTLLHVAGLLDRPNDGSVWIEGQNTGPANDSARTLLRRDRIGFVYQFHHLLPELSALENVLVPQLIAGRDRNKAAARAIELLNKVGVASRAHQRPGELSGGEQQRVAICRAVANRPSVLLADEPTGNLDSETGMQVLDALLDMVSLEGLAILAVTHNLSLAKRMNRILSLGDGLLHTFEVNRVHSS